MTRIFSSTVGFLVSYLVLMIPTYLLPYFGSNSSIINGMAALFGRGPTPQWWMHFWCLVMLVLVAHVRGQLVQKTFLLAFPILALVFDLTPGLSAIPLVPTVMHLLCIILGAMAVVQARDESTEAPTFGGTTKTAAGVSFLSVVGMLWFAVSAQSMASQLKHSVPAPPPWPPAQQAAKKVVEPQPAEPAKPAPVDAPVAQSQPPKALVAKAAPPVNPPTKPAKPAATTQPPQHSDSAKAADKPTVRMINIRD